MAKMKPATTKRELKRRNELLMEDAHELIEEACEDNGVNQSVIMCLVATDNKEMDSVGIAALIKGGCKNGLMARGIIKALKKLIGQIQAQIDECEGDDDDDDDDDEEEVEAGVKALRAGKKLVKNIFGERRKRRDGKRARALFTGKLSKKEERSLFEDLFENLENSRGHVNIKKLESILEDAEEGENDLLEDYGKTGVAMMKKIIKAAIKRNDEL